MAGKVRSPQAGCEDLSDFNPQRDLMRPVRVALLASDLTSPQMRGLARYATGLAAALGQHPDVELLLCARSPLHERYDYIQGERWIYPASREAIWEQFSLPNELRRRSIDVLHAPSNRGLPAFAPCPMVLTRHDAIERIFPSDFKQNRRSRFRMIYSDEISVRRSAVVVTVSEVSRTDIARLWHLPPSRVRNLSEGIDARFFERPSEPDIQSFQKRRGLGTGYIAYLGGFERRKDLGTLIRAMSRVRDLGKRCVIAGRFSDGAPELKQLIRESGVEDLIDFLDEPDDDEAVRFLSGAACFVYPSRYEGFGLQAAESMALGVPLITSDGGSLPEITGGHALTFPVGDHDALERAIRELFNNPGAAIQRADRARDFASKYHWDRVVENYVAMYRSLSSRAFA